MGLDKSDFDIIYYLFLLFLFNNLYIKLFFYVNIGVKENSYRNLYFNLRVLVVLGKELWKGIFWDFEFYL